MFGSLGMLADLLCFVDTACHALKWSNQAKHIDFIAASNSNHKMGCAIEQYMTCHKGSTAINGY